MISLTLAFAGLALLTYRLWPRKRIKASEPLDWPSVSLIVPARNEELHLPVLLRSLQSLDYPKLEVIVVDDNSTDQTATIARSFPVQLIRGQSKPEGWFGKPWACHQGSLIAKGDYLLFTDADTEHLPHSLKTAVSEILRAEAQAFTALPFHKNPELWERLLGPFQLLLLALTAPYGRAKKGRVFAIGQYLIFDTKFYKSFGGHEAIKAEAVDDISLAEQTLAKGGRWLVHAGESLYQVRMYESTRDFIKGWRRNFRGGMKHNTPLSSLEVVLFFMAMTIGVEASAAAISVTALTLLLLAFTQLKIGRFSILGIVFLPVSIAAFTTVSILAVYDRIMDRPLQWKDRAYV